jgi:DNA-binding transcriptional regulator YbjK
MSFQTSSETHKCTFSDHLVPLGFLAFYMADFCKYLEEDLKKAKEQKADMLEPFRLDINNQRNMYLVTSEIDIYVSEYILHLHCTHRSRHRKEN